MGQFDKEVSDHVKEADHNFIIVGACPVQSLQDFVLEFPSINFLIPEKIPKNMVVSQQRPLGSRVTNIHLMSWDTSDKRSFSCRLKKNLRKIVKPNEKCVVHFKIGSVYGKELAHLIEAQKTCIDMGHHIILSL